MKPLEKGSPRAYEPWLGPWNLTLWTVDSGVSHCQFHLQNTLSYCSCRVELMGTEIPLIWEIMSPSPSAKAPRDLLPNPLHPKPANAAPMLNHLWLPEGITLFWVSLSLHMPFPQPSWPSTPIFESPSQPFLQNAHHTCHPMASVSRSLCPEPTPHPCQGSLSSHQTGPCFFSQGILSLPPSV